MNEPVMNSSIPSINLHGMIPQVHCITNHVTSGDCANILLACGAAAVMAEDPSEAAEVTSHCDALVINTGTLHETTFHAMLLSGKTANAKGIPVILDPVGVCASLYRKNAVFRLLEQIQFSVIRGNYAEMLSISGHDCVFTGVETLQETMDVHQLTLLAAECAKKYNCISVISGAIDLIASQNAAYRIHNGSIRCKKVTGAGCMLSSLIGAYCAVNPNKLLSAATSACLMYNLAAEWAEEKTKHLGIGSFRMALFDAVEMLQDPQYQTLVESKVNYEFISSIPSVCSN